MTESSRAAATAAASLDPQTEAVLAEPEIIGATRDREPRGFIATISLATPR